MSARAVRFDSCGGRDMLYVADVPMPVLADGEVLVHVRAAGVNPGETNIRIGPCRATRSRRHSPQAKAATWRVSSPR